jgi:hypothetical protein
MLRITLASLIVVLAASSARAQATVDPATILPEKPATASLSGPRVGVTFLSKSLVDKLYDEEGIEVGPAMTQFGWQFERRFYGGGGGLTLVNEFVFLVGGAEQGLFVPSINWLVGVRTLRGIEFAAGPNVSPTGAALAIAGGITLRSGGLNFPLNVAVVPSQAGTRISFLAGFNARR